jgi:prepilin-type N-terminal cleavage/methylation domain-containing protein
MKRSGFTLIEIMVVVAIIGILIAGVFRLVAAAGENTARAVTVMRIERLQNALAGYYSEYGTYPPVKTVRSGDPYYKNEYTGGSAKETKSSELTSGNATSAARAQPVEFEYPNVQALTEYVNVLYQLQQTTDANTALGGSPGTDSSDWRQTRVFKFGVLSFLLPRVELMGGEYLAASRFGDRTPKQGFFNTAQWKDNNKGELKDVYTREKSACSKWIPNFERLLSGGPSSLMGMCLTAPHRNSVEFSGTYQDSSGSKYVLQKISIQDGWGHDLFYYSAPPYQSYRVWSCGPDGVTFPPWIDLRALPSGDQTKAKGWIEDDISRFDH